MSTVILPEQWRKQPQYRAPIDTEGLGRDLRLLFNPALGPIDLVTGRDWSANGNASVVSSPHGDAFAFDGTDDSFGYTGYPELSGHGTFFCFLPVVGSPDAFGHIYLGSNSPSVMAFQVSNTGGVWIGSEQHGTISSWFNTTNRSIVFVTGPTASQVRVFVDGSTAIASGVAAGASWPSGTKVLRLGNYPGGSNWDTSGQMLIAGWSESLWTEQDALAFHDNPWQIFKPRQRRLWVAPAGGSGHAISGAGQIVSTEAFGSPALDAGVNAVGIATGEAHGSASVAAGVASAGIASMEASGIPAVSSTVSGSGIASAEAFGSADLAATVVASGAASSEAVGSPTVSGIAPAEITGAGQIATAETQGSPALALSIATAGVQGAVAFGDADLSAQVAVAGVATAEAVGAPEVGGLAPAEIAGAGQVASTEAAGLLAVAAAVSATGAGSAAAFGTASLAASVEAAGITSGEVIGAPTVGEMPDQEIIGAGGIVSAESFGSASIHVLVPYTGTSFQVGSAYRRPRPRREQINMAAPHGIGVVGIASQERMGYPALKWRGRSRRIRDDELLLGRVA